ncbi:hypothetical protein K438DRAFT_1978012 [Mycena galopus ATCC 62051]|nr:hypothetical protein K438DRAFT_1978012 [Mycena galopus ATCC 62051]
MHPQEGIDYTGAHVELERGDKVLLLKADGALLGEGTRELLYCKYQRRRKHLGRRCMNPCTVGPLMKMPDNLRLIRVVTNTHHELRPVTRTSSLTSGELYDDAEKLYSLVHETVSHCGTPTHLESARVSVVVQARCVRR